MLGAATRLRSSGSAAAWRCRCFATVASREPQTYIEKVVQRHAVDLAPGKLVRAGDYVMIRPQHVMTHVRRFQLFRREHRELTRRACLQDNTGPVISKWVAALTQLDVPY